MLKNSFLHLKLKLPCCGVWSDICAAACYMPNITPRWFDGLFVGSNVHFMMIYWLESLIWNEWEIHATEIFIDFIFNFFFYDKLLLKILYLHYFTGLFWLHLLMMWFNNMEHSSLQLYSFPNGENLTDSIYTILFRDDF